MRTLRAMRSKTFTRLVGGLAVLGLLGGPLTPGAGADDCQAMLKPVFASSPAQLLYATVTKHVASGSTSATVDPVNVSSGQVTVINEGWGTGKLQLLLPTLSGTLNTLRNADQFAPGKYTLKLSVSSRGDVSVQELLSGKPIPGSPAKVYLASDPTRGSCSSGLVVVVDKNTSWVISFTTGPKIP
jgi:hypothetical protein